MFTEEELRDLCVLKRGDDYVEKRRLHLHLRGILEESSEKWKKNIWIFVGGEKVPVGKTVLLKYYNQSLKNANGSHKSGHRDEFIICSECKRTRGFVSALRRIAGSTMML
ncbi:hypothetical protein HAX54_018051 [Datura stramonium]|uniref:ULTRAPETALA1/2 SAND domain-containing protein n=1 Tax=Datura stramonium TaxID=4076 RepID=A0ABS8S133_DATST|nr:hypothetical protein [Datura stramonium]